MFYPSNPRGEGVPALVADPPAWWKPALALFAALIVQSTLAQMLTFRGALPSFVLLVVLWYALRAGTMQGVLIGTIAGACEDALAGWTGAGWTIATGITGALAGRASNTVATEGPLRVALFTAGATLARYALFAMVVRIEGRPLPLATLHVHAVLWQALFCALIAYAALAFIPRLEVSRVFFR
ncbi:MAG: hypothetical protein GIW95_10475 [Candidatus Eremiobacteraeota bacterium]|nr:hypothetical protein [Candidatus Eremiobacteraeota bacterium]